MGLWCGTVARVFFKTSLLRLATSAACGLRTGHPRLDPAVWRSVHRIGFGDLAPIAVATCTPSGKPESVISMGSLQLVRPTFIISKFDATGTEQWTVVQGSTTSDPVSGRMAVDAAGNCYVAGETWGSVYDTKGAGLADGWFGKYDSDGNLAWGQQINSGGWDTPKNVSIDNAGNLYLVGHTTGSLDGTAAGSADVFVRKYDTDGNLIWGTQFGTDKADRGYDVTANAAGEVYVVGSTSGDLAGISNPGAPYRSGGFLTKLDDNGAILWTELLATDQNDNLYSVNLDSAENVVMAGETIGDLNGQTGAGVQDMLLAKYDASGSEIWTQYLGGSGSDYGYDVAIDGEDNIFFSGKTTSTDGDFAATTAGGLYDAVLAKYDSDGNWIWTERYGGTDTDLISPLHLESDGTLYAGGSTRGAWYEPNLYGSDGVNYDSILMRFDALGAASGGGGGGGVVVRFPNRRVWCCLRSVDSVWR